MESDRVCREGGEREAMLASYEVLMFDVNDHIIISSSRRSSLCLSVCLVCVCVCDGEREREREREREISKDVTCQPSPIIIHTSSLGIPSGATNHHAKSFCWKCKHMGVFHQCC